MALRFPVYQYIMELTQAPTPQALKCSLTYCNVLALWPCPRAARHQLTAAHASQRPLALPEGQVTPRPRPLQSSPVGRPASGQTSPPVLPWTLASPYWGTGKGLCPARRLVVTDREDRSLLDPSLPPGVRLHTKGSPSGVRGAVTPCPGERLARPPSTQAESQRSVPGTAHAPTKPER
ncbi:unnamed protein product [Rangifer tarandus platyrhynchus]|uniref:Uncharacterized protein n=1 Tax=Rangifer tarandus platyrhynchus TaxID=3082113 RepID=A0ABN8Z483_RANTA|nr:unnamed protein product [Rangifer tarandus platyrhynchus]